MDQYPPAITNGTGSGCAGQPGDHRRLHRAPLLSDALALPAGYATPVFLPAGVGFALTVTFGWRALPGIALGALLLHLPNGWAGGRHRTLDRGRHRGGRHHAGLAAAGLARRPLVPAPVDPALDSARDVARFLALAPVFCLINATASAWPPCTGWA
jgi:hypothetical protein